MWCRRREQRVVDRSPGVAAMLEARGRVPNRQLRPGVSRLAGSGGDSQKLGQLPDSDGGWVERIVKTRPL